MRSWLVVGAIGAVLAGCGDDAQVVDLPYEAAKAAKAAGDAALSSWLADARGKTVRWSGHVVEAQRVRGDDFIEEALVLIDMDEGAAGAEAPDVIMQIPVSQVDALGPGQAVTYVATVRDIERSWGTELIRLELKEIN